MTSHALVVGSQIEGLTGVVHDTHRMRDLLCARGFDVDLRLDGSATRSGILDGYDALISRARAGDAAVIYYSGHGLCSQNSDPADRLRVVQSIAPTDLRAGHDRDFRGITAWELAIKLAQLTAKTRNVTVILDCCHAARMTRDARAPDLVVRALPNPVRMGFRAHLAALEQRYGKVALDPVGNPDAVRVVACGQREPAFEYTNRAGRRSGVFTDALLEILQNVGDAPISWAAIGDAIRERVTPRFVQQRPDVEGPSERRVFSLAVDSGRGSHAVAPCGEAFRVHAGWLTGASPGDVHRVMPLGCVRPDDRRAIATLELVEVGPMTSTATVQRWHAGHAALREDAVAIPVATRAPRHPVGVVAPAAERAVIAQALEAEPTLRPAEPPGEPALATLRLTGDRLTIEDPAGPLGPPLRHPGELVEAIRILANLGVAQRLRERVGAFGLDPATLEIGWGTVCAGARQPMPDHGAAVGLHERIYVRVANTGALVRYVHVINIGVCGKVSLLTKLGAPAGFALGPQERFTLGEQDDRLVGLPLVWPDGLSRETAPQLDELLVLVTAQPINLYGLETHEPRPRGAARGASFQRASAGRPAHSAPPAPPATPAPRDAFLIKRLSYLLHPRMTGWTDPSPDPAPGGVRRTRRAIG
ncbi:MAG TPA: caspase family protein [Kofleriaceae bacterium]|nr:caspase family protein [Kofleriaceae bacterium]